MSRAEGVVAAVASLGHAVRPMIVGVAQSVMA